MGITKRNSIWWSKKDSLPGISQGKFGALTIRPGGLSSFKKIEAQTFNCVMLDVERVKLAGSIDDVTLTEMNTVAWFACLDLLSCKKHAMW